MIGLAEPKAPEILRGGAALVEAINLIGVEGKTDHDVAGIIVAHEVEIMEFIAFGLSKFAEKL